VQRAELSAEEDRVIAKSCPGLSARQHTPDGARRNPLWGPYISVRRGYASDPVLRRAASSGGVLSALLIHLLNRGQVDYVVQTGASPTVPYGNVTVRSFGADDVHAAAGSRYAPSAPLAGLDDLLAQESRFAFVGKPCDIAALRALARFDPRVERRIPYAISFFCAGAPSLSGAREVIDRLGVDQHSDVVSFRYRGDGWPGYATAVLGSGERRRMSYAASWGGILTNHVQFRCKICPDGVGGLADVVCADAWHCDARGYPLFEEQDGWSLIISRTERGEALVRDALASGAINAEVVDVNGLAAMQPGQAKRKALVLSRLAAMAVVFKPVPRFVGFQLFEAARGRGPLANLRSFLGTLRRLLMPGTRSSRFRAPGRAGG
jgi:coenzyme F420 hydrogenase subunit beta